MRATDALRLLRVVSEARIDLARLVGVQEGGLQQWGRSRVGDVKPTASEAAAFPTPLAWNATESR